LEIFEDMDKLYMVFNELDGGSLLEIINNSILHDQRLTNEDIGAIVY
jgi:hypothetical protein